MEKNVKIVVRGIVKDRSKTIPNKLQLSIPANIHFHTQIHVKDVKDNAELWKVLK
jgi:hypothetical protein